jgi:hypothetical protein
MDVPCKNVETEFTLSSQLPAVAVESRIEKLEAHDAEPHALGLLVRAEVLIRELQSGQARTQAELAARHNVTNQYINYLLRVRHLAPVIAKYLRSPAGASTIRKMTVSELRSLAILATEEQLQKAAAWPGFFDGHITPLTARKIVEIVAAELCVDLSMLLGDSIYPDVVDARDLVIYLCRKVLGLESRDIRAAIPTSKKAVWIATSRVATAIQERSALAEKLNKVMAALAASRGVATPHRA